MCECEVTSAKKKKTAIISIRQFIIGCSFYYIHCWIDRNTLILTVDMSAFLLSSPVRRQSFLTRSWIIVYQQIRMILAPKIAAPCIFGKHSWLMSSLICFLLWFYYHFLCAMSAKRRRICATQKKKKSAPDIFYATLHTVIEQTIFKTL